MRPAPMARSETPEPVRLADGVGGRRHRVAEDESLWSIAHATLGRDASLTDVARYVRRLWAYNAERIGTADPDVVMPGTLLELPPIEN